MNIGIDVADGAHAYLCERAKRWLRGSARCGIVLGEMVSWAGEVPDAIGWRSGHSILIEVKISRADFHADARKPWRLSPASGMGDWRFYLTFPGLLGCNEIPEGWGLLEAHDKYIQRVYMIPSADSWETPPNMGNKRKEILLLCSALRRLGIKR